MQISDLIQLVGVLVALVVGTVSLIISIKTLKQNSKMIEESTRPYIVIYYEMTNLSVQKGYFVIKNFGGSGAYITKFEYDDIINKTNFEMSNIEDQFRTIEGLFLAPNQKILIKLYKVPTELKTLDFRIGYKSNSRSYPEETFKINMNVVAQHMTLRTNPSDVIICADDNSPGYKMKIPNFINYSIEENIERKL